MIMERYRHFILNQKLAVVWGVLQVACASLCVVCGLIDAVFRMDTTLSETRAPLWAGLVNVMIVSSVVSHVATVIVFVYAGVTLSYGEEDDELFHPRHITEVKFVLSRMVKAANSTMVLAGVGSFIFSSLIAYTGCRSLPLCGCYDSVTGMEMLVTQNDPSASGELVCSWHGGDERLFNSPVSFTERCPEQEQELSALPPYSRLT
ncbi:uncharacterized protein zgc:113425 isoform X2 [Ictalurus furcatus]|uniref:uncharacterized protein zgc:113425 isoform X2 n=1 Tax=Ictalurus furcatus TaxID=66913 RepID=UPI0023504D87|nr:uncharacterized protein zgc:113425 isoform X2 [Ictalurus furcatus]